MNPTLSHQEFEPLTSKFSFHSVCNTLHSKELYRIIYLPPNGPRSSRTCPCRHKRRSYRTYLPQISRSVFQILGFQILVFCCPRGEFFALLSIEIGPRCICMHHRLDFLAFFVRQFLKGNYNNVDPSSFLPFLLPSILVPLCL